MSGPLPPLFVWCRRCRCCCCWCCCGVAGALATVRGPADGGGGGHARDIGMCDIGGPDGEDGCECGLGEEIADLGHGRVSRYGSSRAFGDRLEAFASGWLASDGDRYRCAAIGRCSRRNRGKGAWIKGKISAPEGASSGGMASISRLNPAIPRVSRSAAPTSSRAEGVERL